MAPTTKPPGQRERRNKDQGQWRTLAADLDRPVPDWPLDEQPHADTWQYWSRLWASPMAAMFTEMDELPLARLARLHSEALAGDDKAMSAVTALEDRYGISPKARRALQWEIEQGGGDAAPGQPVDDEVARRRDRKKRLAA